MTTSFAGSRTILKIQSTRIEKRPGKTSHEAHYYLSSQEAGERTPGSPICHPPLVPSSSSEGWIDLSRSHCAGVEDRNHCRRDATLGAARPKRTTRRPSHRRLQPPAHKTMTSKPKALRFADFLSPPDSLPLAG